MKKIFILLISIILFINCSDKNKVDIQNKVDVQNKPLSSKQIDSILSTHEEKFLFLSFYPEMEKDIFNMALKREYRKGNLDSGKMFEIPIKIASDAFVLNGKSIRLQTNSEPLNFSISSNKYNVELKSFNESTYTGSSTIEKLNDTGDYPKVLLFLLKLYKEKYSNYEEYLGKVDLMNSQPRGLNSSYIFEHDDKVILVLGNFFKDRTFDKVTFRKVFRIKYFSKKTFDSFKKEIIKIEKKNDSIKNSDLNKIEKRRNKLINKL